MRDLARILFKLFMFSFLLGGCIFNVVQFQKLNKKTSYDSYDRYNPNRNDYYNSSQIDMVEEPTNELDEVTITRQNDEEESITY